MRTRILLIDDDDDLRNSMGTILSKQGHVVTLADSYDSALSELERSEFDVVLSDIVLGGKTGIDVLEEIKKRKLNTTVVMITGAPSLETASRAVSLGALEYVTKPFSMDVLRQFVERAGRHQALINEKESYRANLDATFSSVKDAIVTLDSEMKIIEANKSTESLCGFKRGSIGENFADFTEACSGKCLEVVEQCIRDKSTVEISHVECHRKNKPLKVINICASPLHYSDGRVSGAVLVVMDETRLAVLERDLKKRKQFHGIIGSSKHMQEIYGLIETFAHVESTVLVLGESGTGKELVTDALHYTGGRSKFPLVKVNCAALSENLLESELFGHVKGAFTGADADRVGRIEMAQGGTLLLDEIGDISEAVQVKLLRVLQDKQFERVGENKPRKADIRIITATNRDLKQRVADGRFREDLFYRLNVLKLSLPSLRQHKEDIPMLLAHFVEIFNDKFNKTIEGVSKDVMNEFMKYDWPGNVRELEHAIEYAAIICQDKIITLDHLPEDIRANAEVPSSSPVKYGANEHESIVEALENAKWSKSLAAKVLGISRATLYRKIKEYNIKF
jgi:PAS domain S-box-containing protein